MTQTAPDQILHEALEHHQNGRVEEATVAYQRLVKAAATDQRAVQLLALVAAQGGQNDLARKAIENFLVQHPDSPGLLYTLALIEIGSERPVAAVSLLQRAESLTPNNPSFIEALGRARLAEGRVELAKVAFNQALLLDAQNAESHNGLGRVALVENDWAGAEERFLKAHDLKPAWPAPAANLAILYNRWGRWKDAEVTAMAVLARHPHMVVVRCALVDSCIGQQRPDAALRAVKEFSEQGSQSHAAQNAWGRALCAGGKHTEAIAHFEHALASDERSVESLNNLAHAHRMIGNLERALDAIERALALDDGRGECWNNRGLVMLEMAESSEAERCFHRAIELAEWHEASHLNHAHVAWSLGQLDESIKRLERAHEALPSSGAVRSRLLMAMHYSPRYAPKRLKAFAEDWATGMGEAGSRLERVERNKAPFRIGLVSADFREHPVGRSVRRLIPKWVAQGAEVYAYSNRPDGDDTTAAIRSECTSFRLIDALSDDAVEATIRGDRIDALVDLSGHTHGHRLAVFHRCPAPVQLTWMGFFGTTGMDCFDGVLSDQTVIPNSGGPQHTERVVHLGRCFFAVDPLDLPDVPVTPPPSLMGGGVTFGSFNNPLKYNVDVVRLWCRILDSVPGSRLLLCYPSRTPAITQAHALKMFVDAGLSAERIEVRCDLNRSQALAEYGRVDIALDPSPVNGGMTTVEAMWMGVPVLGIRGDRQSSRIGASFVEAVGHPDWTAPSEEDLIRLASSLSADEAGRVEIRKRLRIQLRLSTLCDTDGLALAALDAMRNAMDAPTQ